jgi:hypothetical protein
MSSTLYTGSNYGVISSGNSYTGSLDSNLAINGSYENIQNYSLISVSLSGTSTTVPSGGTLVAYFSNDGTDATILSTISVAVQDVNATGINSSGIVTTNSTAFNPSHTFVPTSKFFKLVYRNGSSALSALNISVIYHTTSNKTQTSNCTQLITDYTDADLNRSILTAKTEGTQLPGGNYQNINALNGSLNVRIRDPISAFGEMLTASLTPFVQFDFTSGIPLDVLSVTQNSVSNTSYTYFSSMGKISAITGTDSYITLKSNIYTKYKPGQGCDNRFTALFPNKYIAGCDQYAGVFTPEDSLTFGYFDGHSEFAIRWQSFGNQQINRFTVTIGSLSTISTPFPILNFGGTNVTITTVNTDTIEIICYKIVTAINAELNLNTYGYIAEYYSDGAAVSPVYTINIIRNIASGNISITPSNPTTNGITLTASSPNPLVSGLLPTTVVYEQSNWNLNNCKDNGTLELNYRKNSGGFILYPEYGNVFKIFFQYLGFGQITFCIEESSSESIIPVHRITYPSSAPRPTLKNPSMNIGIGIKNTTSSTGTPIVQTASMASFLQGNFKPSFIYRSFGFTLFQVTQTPSSPTPTLPLPLFVIFGLQVANIFSSTNNANALSPTTNYLINKNNLILSNISTSVNAATNTSTNIHFVLVKNPTSVLQRAPSGNINDLKYVNNNNSLINTLNGDPPKSNTTGIIISGGSQIIDIILTENTNAVTDLSNLNIILSPNDSLYVCYYGTTSAVCDISASLSYNVNM